MTSKDITKIAVLVELGGKVYHVKVHQQYRDYILQMVAQLNDNGLELFPQNIETLKFEEL